MRIPFPERIPWLYSTTFAFLLLVLQLLTGTDLIFSLLCFFFVITCALAFNVAGGMARPSGSYVIFFALLAVIIGLVVKVIYLEPGQSRLRVPIPLMETYLAGAVGLLVAVAISRRISLRKGLLQDFLHEGNMRSAVIGCVIAGVVLSLLAPLAAIGQQENAFTPIIRALNQLNRFLDMAIILGVTYQIRKSGGKSSLNFLVLFAWAVAFFEGVLLGYSKEALFSPFLCWIAAAAVLRYQFRPYQIVLTGALVFFMYFYMVPYCQVGRVYRSATNTFSQNFAISRNLLSNLGEVRREDADQREAEEEAFDDSKSLLYFNKSHGLVDRLQMLSIDDTLHVVTDENGASGLPIVAAYFINVVPRVFWKNKPDIVTANQYGHELGLLAPEDETTSVSVSPIGEAYRIAKWGGILLLLPALWTLLFVVMDSVCGDLRRSPWGILVLAIFAHGANEGGVVIPIYMVTFGLFGLIFVAFCTSYVFPFFASFVTPTRKKDNVPPGIPRARFARLQ